MDLSNASENDLRAALSAKTGVQDPVLQAGLIDARAGLAMFKPTGQWTQEDVAAVRARVNQLLQQGW
jgi:hypothetical protein